MKIALPLLVLLSAAPVFAVPVSVSIVDDKGKPIAGADVQLESFGKTPRGFVLQQTNEQGITTFDIEPSVHSYFKDFAGRIFARKSGFGIGSGALLFKKPLRIELNPPAKVSGKIVDPEGKPIQGATISFLSVEAKGHSSEMLTDGPLLPQMTTHSAVDGSWQLDGIPTDVQVYVQVSAPERVGVRTKILAGGRADATLRPGAQIKGRLLGLDGKPLADIHVSAQGTKNNIDYSGDSTKTAADGTYVLDGLSSGAFNVMFYVERESPFVIPSFQSVNATIGKPLQLPEAKAIEGILISGHIWESATKKPVSGVEIGVQGGVNPFSSAAVSTTPADENGAWQMRTVPGEGMIYLMSVPQEFKQDQQQRKMQLGEKGESNIDFTLERLPKITGRIIDEAGKGVQLTLQLRRDNDMFWATSDENGDFTSYGPTDGEWRVSADEREWGLEPAGDAWELVGPARMTVVAAKPLEIRLRRASTDSVELGVYDDDDIAIAGARVLVNVLTGQGENQSMQQRELISDKGGRARIENLRANQRIEIASAKKQGYDTAPLPKPDHVGRTWNAAITLIKRSGHASGQIVGANGEVAARALVSGSGVDVRADEKGHFDLAPLPKGVTPVFAWKEEGFAFSSSDKNQFELKAQTLEPTNPAKAKEILDYLAEQAKGVEYYKQDSLEYEVGSFDELAAKIQQKPVKGAVTTLIARFGRDKTISASHWFPVLLSSKEAGRRLYDTSEWMKTGPVIEANEDARKFLQALQADVAEVEPLFKKEDNWMMGHGIFAAAAVAEKMGDTAAADVLFERARTFTENAYGRTSDRDYGIIGPIVAASPRLLLKAAALVPETNGNRAILMGEGVPVLARSVGLDAVKPLLDQLKNAPQPKPDSYGDTWSADAQWRSAIIGSIKVAGKTNPALALELAKSLPTTVQFSNYHDRDIALCEAAFFQTPEISHQLWSESLPHLSPDKAMSFVVRILKTDELFAREQYLILATAMDAIVPRDPAEGLVWGAPSPAIFAFYEARFNPARARFRLERAFAAAQTNSNGDLDVSIYAQVMALFDANRAIGWTGKSTGAINDSWGNFETRRRIAQWLVLGEEGRQNTFLSTY